MVAMTPHHISYQTDLFPLFNRFVTVYHLSFICSTALCSYNTEHFHYRNMHMQWVIKMRAIRCRRELVSAKKYCSNLSFYLNPGTIVCFPISFIFHESLLRIIKSHRNLNEYYLAPRSNLELFSVDGSVLRITLCWAFLQHMEKQHVDQVFVYLNIYFKCP